MTPQLASNVNSLPGARKAAMFLMGIGDEISADVIRQLGPEEIKKISVEISSLQAVPPEQMLDVFMEFEALSATSKYFAQGGAGRARQLIEQAVGAEAARFVLGEFVPPPVVADASGPFHDIDSQELARVFREENPQTLAIILSNLPPEQAGPLMASLPPEKQPQVALRIALMDRLSPEVFSRIATAIQSRLKASKQLKKSDGTKALAAILNHVGGNTADGVLDALEPENQVTIAAVRQLMFVFEDVVNIDQNGIKALLAKADRKILTIALKGTSERIKTHFTQCMSQRSSEMLLEDMEALGPVRISDVAAAQQQLVALVRQLEKDGTISTSRGGGDDFVV